MNLMRTLGLGLTLLLALPAAAGGKKKSNAGISFHLETHAGENPKMVATQFVAGKERFFRRMPEVGTKDISSFNPFPSQEGQGYGVVFRLKPGPSNRLAGVTSANTGRWLLARINGRAVDAVMIDQQISDGELIIWKGISLGEIQSFDKKFPRLGERKPRG